MKTNTSKVLMSEVLKGQIDSVDENFVDELLDAGVFVILNCQSNVENKTLSGVLRSVLFDEVPELELRLEISSALDLVKINNLSILSVQLQHGASNTVDIPGPFKIKAARIEELDVPNQLCVLSLQLLRSRKM